MTETVRYKLMTGYYNNKLEYPKNSAKGAPAFYEAVNAYHAEEYRINKMFEEDLAAEFGLTEHPKRQLLFDKAWANGHAYGLQEVYEEYADLKRLLEE
jgi:hypothetical protein